MRSRNDLPGSCVISTTIRSDSTRVPPVTAERSPPASRMTGADSPVIADSSTLAIPSITVPSPGMTSPAATTTTSPLAARTRPPRGRCPAGAVVVVRISRSAAAWALPRPSASASARLAKTTVSHSQTAIVTVNQRGSPEPPTTVAGDRRHGRADLDHEHHRVAQLDARVELLQRRDEDVRGDLRGAAAVGRSGRGNGDSGHRSSASFSFVVLTLPSPTSVSTRRQAPRTPRLSGGPG